MIDLWDLANPNLRELVAYEPGKPVEDVARELGLDPANVIKVASNENPLGPSPRAVEAMERVARGVHIYPDGGAWRLRGAIADRVGLGRESVVVGNGSNEIIELLGHAFLRPGDEVLVSDHAFVVYKLMATLFGGVTVEVAEGPGMGHDLEAMAAAITPRTRQIFVANPNNPTGTLVGQDEIDRFMERVPDSAIVIFDEAYFEFLDSPPDTLKYVREGRRVVVLRTFSKIQGLAGLRVGYGLMPEDLAGVLQKARQPFNVNLMAQEAALAAIVDEEHQRATKLLTDEGRAYLEGEFERLGWEYIPSHANFVLVRVGDGDAVFAEMMRRGVILRAMRGYKLPEWVRVSVGTMEQNRRVMAELVEVVGTEARRAVAAGA